jgi:hypothetical protein
VSEKSPKGLINILQAAAESGRHPETIRKAVQRGELPFVRQRFTKKLFFKPADLRDWADSVYVEVPVRKEEPR